MKTKIFFTALIAVLIAGLHLAAQPAAENNNLKMADNVYLPPAFDKNKTYPAIVVVHPGGGVKEQTACLYAQKLAEAGFVTLAFNTSYHYENL